MSFHLLAADFASSEKELTCNHIFSSFKLLTQFPLNNQKLGKIEGNKEIGKQCLKQDSVPLLSATNKKIQKERKERKCDKLIK